MTSTLPERVIALKGCLNFRDLGGYETEDGRQVRWRRLFRSDSLHQLLDEDVATLHSLEVRPVTGIDLRTSRELEFTGAGPMFDNGAKHHHFPVIDVIDPENLRRQQSAHLMYLEMLESAGERIRGVFEVLADEASYPAVFYCAGGKDRTGITAALILRALGVKEEHVVADYALTKPIPEERIQARMQEFSTIIGGDMAERLKNMDPSLLQAREETMADFLEGVGARYGSVTAYLGTLGVDGEMIAALRGNLLE